MSPLFDPRGEIDAELELHDDLIRRRGVEITVGAEPTFSRADSADPPWLVAAQGGDKLQRAHDLAERLALPDGARWHRVLGRRYPGEDEARFCLGARWRRGGIVEAREDGVPSWPRDVFVAPTRVPSVDAFIEAAPDLADSEAWLTITPDPGVIEVNLAPCDDAAALLDQARVVWDAASAAGLSARRLRWNGELTDSGGGGQLTLGGRTPTASPFVRYPRLLPSLLRYVNNHPSLSYWFASECVGSASQSPRPDEGVRERYEELAMAIDWAERLAGRGELDADRLWRCFAPLLVDASGNSHRAEINIEKLWNPYLERAGRRHGQMGVVELRAFKMPARPSMLAAAAALLRAIVTRLVVGEYRTPLIAWEGELHDRFGLPSYLRDDLQHVLGDLDEHGVGLPAGLRAEIAAYRDDGIRCQLGAGSLTLTPALEFWPLVGDVASQEESGARLVDASTERWEIAVSDPSIEAVTVMGRKVTLRPCGAQRVVGVRRRRYQPIVGLHPGAPAQDPLVVEWSAGGRHQRVELWSWQPSGGGYDGLPASDDEAARRRSERVVVTTSDGAAVRRSAPSLPIGAAGRGTYTIDVRRDFASSDSPAGASGSDT